jgi:hypothetical protein
MIRSYQGLFWYWGSTAPAPPGGQLPAATRYRKGYRIQDVTSLILTFLGL